MKIRKITKITISVLVLFPSTGSVAQPWQKLGAPNGELNMGGFGIAADHDNKGKVYAANGYARNYPFNYVAQWDGTSWSDVGMSSSALNVGFNGFYDLIADTSGNVYVTGEFFNGSGEPYIAKWNGTSWTDFSTSGLKSLILLALAKDDKGYIYVSGAFDNSYKRNVAKWDGRSWTILGGSNNGLNANSEIYAIAIDENTGMVYAGGNFTNGNSNGSGFHYVARWDGVSWTEVVGTNAIKSVGSIDAIVIDPCGTIYATANRLGPGQAGYVAKFDGISWTELGGTGSFPGLNGGVHGLSKDPAGNIYAGGYFENKQGLPFLAKFDGVSWTEVQGIPATDTVNSLSAPLFDRFGNVFVPATGYRNNDHSNNVYRFESLDHPDTSHKEFAHEILLCEEAILLAPKDNQSTQRYLWNTKDTGAGISIKEPGRYWVRTAHLSPKCVIRTDTFHIVGATMPKLNDPAVICWGTATRIAVENAAYASYLWNTGATGSAIDVDQTGTYSVTVTYADSVRTLGECQLSDTTTLVVRDPVPVPITEDAEFCIEQQDIQLPVYGQDLQWYSSLEDSSAQHSPFTTVQKPGKFTYYVSQTVEGCESERVPVQLTWKACNADCLFLPTAFSPDGNGINDLFEPVLGACNISNYQLEIYDRWGNQLYRSIHPNQGWDGNYKGQSSELGTYFFSLSYYAGTQHYAKKGDLTLIR